MVKKIASSDTTMVKRIKGNGSMGLILGTKPALMVIHPAKSKIFKKRNVIVPKNEVRESAIRTESDRFLSALASKLWIRRLECLADGETIRIL